MTPQEIEKISIDRALGTRSMEHFVRMAWNQVEPNSLRWNWHMSAVCAHLEAVTRGEIQYLVICIPPGMSKSLLVSTFWPAWDWLIKPSRRLIAATYAQELSDKNAELQRNLVAGEWFRRRWGDRVSLGGGNKTKVRFFKNEQGGFRFSSSVGGAMTGLHGDHLLFDDLVNATDAEGRNYVDPLAIEKANTFWFRVMHTRRLDAGSTARVGIAQRLHHEDTPGRCIDAGYTALVLPQEYDSRRHCHTPIYWTRPDTRIREEFSDIRTVDGELLDPVRFPKSVLDGDKKALGAIAYEAQQQQNPTPAEGAIFKNAGAHRWTALPDKNFVKIITVDCAFKDTKTSDFVAIHVWGKAGNNFYMVDRDHGRKGLHATIQAILDMAARHPLAAIYVEDKANGSAVIETLTGEVPGLHAWSPGADSKTGRAEAVAALVTAGNVWFPPDSVAPWIGDVLTTIKRFPLVKYDDDVDAMTMALRVLYSPKQARYIESLKTWAKERIS